MRLIKAEDVCEMLDIIADSKAITTKRGAIAVAKTGLDDIPVIDPESLHPQGEWEWFEEWSPSTPEHPRECNDCGWRCGKCNTAWEDMVGGYWDVAFEKPTLNFCPNCGVKMTGGDSR